MEMLPENLLPKIRKAFEDLDLSSDEDIKECVIHYSPQYDNCFLMYRHEDLFNKGTLVCVFGRDGKTFHWGKSGNHFFERDKDDR